MGNNDYLEIHHINVGCGDATLIRIMNEDPEKITNILIDVGRHFMPISTYLNDLGIKEVEYFIASHYHIDHLGGLKKSPNNFLNLKIQKLIDIGYYKKTDEKTDKKLDEQTQAGLKNDYTAQIKGLLTGKDATAECFKNYVSFIKEKKPAKRVIIEKLPMEIELGKINGEDVKLICVAGNGMIPGDNNISKYAIYKEKGEPPVPVPPNDLNDLSLAFILKCNKFIYFTGGDLSGNTRNTNHTRPDIETELAEYLKEYEIDFIKVSHHGSKYSTSDYFLDTLNPKNAIIFPFHYMHNKLPATETLNRLNDKVEKIYFICDKYEETENNCASKENLKKYVAEFNEVFEYFKGIFIGIKLNKIKILGQPCIKITKSLLYTKKQTGIEKINDKYSVQYIETEDGFTIYLREDGHRNIDIGNFYYKINKPGNQYSSNELENPIILDNNLELKLLKDLLEDTRKKDTDDTLNKLVILYAEEYFIKTCNLKTEILKEINKLFSNTSDWIKGKKGKAYTLSTAQTGLNTAPKYTLDIKQKGLIIKYPGKPEKFSVNQERVNVNHKRESIEDQVTKNEEEKEKRGRHDV